MGDRAGLQPGRPDQDDHRRQRTGTQYARLRRRGDRATGVAGGRGRKGLRLTFEDHGPGIADIELALTDGYTTGKGMGMGLSGSKRLVNEFEIDSRVGEGTRVTITRWK